MCRHHLERLPFEAGQFRHFDGLETGTSKHYRITTVAVARAVEALLVIASPGTVLRHIGRSSLNPFAFARICYDHLAGRLDWLDELKNRGGEHRFEGRVASGIGCCFYDSGVLILGETGTGKASVSFLYGAP